MALKLSLNTRLVGVAACALLVLGLAACSNSGDTGTATPGSNVSQAAGPNDSPGVTDSEIRYASFGTRTNNPTGQCFQECMDDGIQAYFAWRNDQGGIYGRKLVLSEQLDDQLMQNQQRALEVVSNEDVFGAFSAAAVATGWKELAASGIPLYTMAISFNEMNGNPSIWGNLGVQCISCISRFAPYSAELAGAKKVSALGYGIAQSSKDCVASVAKTVEKYGPTTGQSMAYTNDSLTYGLPNGIANEVTAMKSAGTDLVQTCLDSNGVKTLAQEMQRQGLKATISSNNLYNQSFVAENKDLFEGAIVTVAFRPFEAGAGASDSKYFQEYMEKTGKTLSEQALIGWANADLAYQGLKAAGPNFTRASVVEATNKLNRFTAGGMIGAIDWTKQHEFPTDADPTTHAAPAECYAFVKVKDGKFELAAGDKDKPFMCWPIEYSKWIEPTPTNME